MRRLVWLLLAIGLAATAVSLIFNAGVIKTLANGKTVTVNAPPPIVKISICRPDNPSGTLQPGSCTQGFDTHQLVLGKRHVNSTASPVPINDSNMGVGPVPDEHSTVYAPGTLDNNADYLFFLSTGSGGHGNIGVSVLSGGGGPDGFGQWTLSFPKPDEGYGFYGKGIGYGPVFETSTKPGICPAVPDGSPAEQDQTFDMHYASAGSIVKDPTAPPGSMLMIYEGTNACIGNAGGNVLGNNDDYITLAIATSLDYGRKWPTYRGTDTFDYVPLPNVNQSQAPHKAMGAWGGDVCAGNCPSPLPTLSPSPPADSYGRYAVVSQSPSLDYFMTQPTPSPLTAKFGEQEISGFVDDVSGTSPTYLYANWGNVKIGRAALNQGQERLTFHKWNGGTDWLTLPGIGGDETNSSILQLAGLTNSPDNFTHCLDPSQKQFGSSISYVEQTHQYLLTFVCVSAKGDPQLGDKQTDPRKGAAWFYATNYNLSDPTQWSPQDENGHLQPIEIDGSWGEFTDQTEPTASPTPSPAASPCNEVYKGFYPSFMSMENSAGHLSLDGYVFYLWGCQPGGTVGGRKFSSRQFKITTTDTTPPVTTAAVVGPSGANGWYTGSTTVSFTATDDLSGVATTQYSVNGGPWTGGTSVQLTSSGIYHILYQSIDVDENVETAKSITVDLDSKAPVTTAAVTGPAGLNGWYTGPTTVNLTATDDLSGVAKTEYSLDGGFTWTAGTSVSFGTNTINKLLYRSADVAGNVETPNSISVNLDSKAPVITESASPSTIFNKVRVVDVTISGKITDNLAGVDPATARFAVHDEYGTVQPSGPVTIAGDGTYSFIVALRTFVRTNDTDGRLYTIHVSAADYAGNRRAAETFVAAKQFRLPPPPCKPNCV
jgi:hypothetical protein